MKKYLASACSLLRHLGSYETKGKGQVEVSMYKEDKDVTFEYINLLREGEFKCISIYSLI